MTHTQEIQDLINTALHAPATGSIVIQGALFLDIISRMENAEQQNTEMKEQSSRLAAEAVRQAQQNADLCVKNAELLNVIKWANNHGGLGYSIHGEFEKAIAKAGK